MELNHYLDSRSTVFGGVLFGLIEGVGIMLNKILSAQQQMWPEEPMLAGYPSSVHVSQPSAESKVEGSWSKWHDDYVPFEEGMC
ncbi:hypothetical protein PIB30_061039 [Stylosanthes scabra]|uniref:Uncharacterized protein n=1 Tax=Stylosanthes scabra TaxID=79078 RepID=A0ABU6RLV1_9FABA|nr:hypothetical protein [Stylosanthes scabra]